MSTPTDTGPDERFPEDRDWDEEPSAPRVRPTDGPPRPELDSETGPPPRRGGPTG